MEPNYNFPMGNNNNNAFSEHQTIRTQIVPDTEWDQFWKEYNALNTQTINNHNDGGIDVSNQDFKTSQLIESQLYATTEHHLPPVLADQLDLPEYGSNMFIPTYIDAFYDSPRIDPSPWVSTSTSTSNSSPTASAYTSQKSIYSSNTSTPNTTPSSASFDTPSSQTSIPSPSSSSASSFICSFCNKTFPQKCLLHRHINTHTKPYHCLHPHCTERRATNRDLKRHMAVHDRVSAPAFLCAEAGCEFGVRGRGFTRKDHLKRHVENVHGRQC